MNFSRKKGPVDIRKYFLWFAMNFSIIFVLGLLYFGERTQDGAYNVPLESLVIAVVFAAGISHVLFMRKRKGGRYDLLESELRATVYGRRVSDSSIKVTVPYKNIVSVSLHATKLAKYFDTAYITIITDMRDRISESNVSWFSRANSEYHEDYLYPPQFVISNLTYQEAIQIEEYLKKKVSEHYDPNAWKEELQMDPLRKTHWGLLGLLVLVAALFGLVMWFM